MIHRSSFVLAAALLLASCHGRPTVERSSAGSGERHPVAADAVAAPGLVEPWGGEVQLSSLEPGVLTELLVDEGAAVRKGTLLARLDDSPQRHAVAIAEADLRQTEAQLGGLASTVEEIRSAEAELRAAEARAEQRRRELERARSLGNTGTLAVADVERAASSASVDEAGVDAARARLRLTQRGARHSERKLALARHEAALARLEEARAALARREVRAPSDGVVLWSRYHPGEFYAPAQGPLLVLGSLERLQVRLEVDEGDAQALGVGARCELRGDDGAPLGEGTLHRVALEYGARGLQSERPTTRSDARVREAFVEVAPLRLAPGQRVWGYCRRQALQASR